MSSLKYWVRRDQEKMETNVLVLVGIVVVWIVLNRWILPKLGIST
jgi:hypothetical protein